MKQCEILQLPPALAGGAGDKKVLALAKLFG
jgi:hypothetical protein